MNPMVKDRVQPSTSGVTGVAFGDNERLAAQKAGKAVPAPATPEAGGF